MTDLLERLRMRCACVSDRDPCPRCKQEFEAAAEIERLKMIETQLRSGIERVIDGEAGVGWLSAWYPRAVQTKEKEREVEG